MKAFMWLVLAAGLDRVERGVRRKTAVGGASRWRREPQHLAASNGPVSEKAAKRIVEHRTKAPFARPEELVKVKGGRRSSKS